MMTNSGPLITKGKLQWVSIKEEDLVLKKSWRDSIVGKMLALLVADLGW